MAIVNRDKDSSEQKEVLHWQGTVTAGTFQIAHIPYPCEVKAIVVDSIGLSGSPTVEVEAYKFSGGITINSALSSALTVTAWGTSGSQDMTLGTAGSTQVLLDARSKLVLRAATAASAVNDCCVAVVVQKLQDIVSYDGE